MNLSNAGRVQKLFTNLLLNPDLLAPYVSKSVFNKQLPIDLNLPWWSFRAIEYADQIFFAKNVFEFGTGGSTIRYAPKCKLWTSVEDDANWLKLVRGRLEQADIKNVELIHQYFDFDNPINFDKSAYLGAFDPSKDYDVIIIDGQDTTFRERITCFRHVEPTIKAGGVIVVDDWWRYTELLATNRAKSIKVFESVGPCRYGVTSTAFFHY